MNFLKRLLGLKQAVTSSSSSVVNSPTVDFPTPRHVYSHLLSRLTGGYGEFAMFSKLEASDQWVQVTELHDEVIELNFAYPYDENPDLRFVTTGIEMPEGSALSRWQAGSYASYTFPKCPSTQLVNCVDDLFNKILHVSDTDLIGGWVG